MTDRRTLRKLVEAEEILVMPVVFNGFSVRLVERYGYKAAAISGAGLSKSLLCWADRGILTFEDNLRALPRARAMHSAPAPCRCRPPGYGNALNVYFVARAFEQAGARCDLDRGSGLAQAPAGTSPARR